MTFYVAASSVVLEASRYWKPPNAGVPGMADFCATPVTDPVKRDATPVGKMTSVKNCDIEVVDVPVQVSALQSSGHSKPGWEH
jgi:hypothetical protein